MSSATATETPSDLRTDLESRFETAVGAAMRQVAGVEAERVGVEEQTRDTGRMTTIAVTMMGEGWMGSVMLLIPTWGAEAIGRRLLGLEADDELRGPDLAESLGGLSAGAGLDFGSSFASEGRFTVGMPVVVSGDDIAVSFPWSRHFETRQSFRSVETPFWAILRLAHGGSEIV